METVCVRALLLSGEIHLHKSRKSGQMSDLKNGEKRRRPLIWSQSKNARKSSEFLYRGEGYTLPVFRWSRCLL